MFLEKSVSDVLDAEFEDEHPFSTGLLDLDRAVGGMRKGEIWVITGEPGIGKSLLLVQLVHVLAVQHGFRVDYRISDSDRPQLARNRLLNLTLGRPVEKVGEASPPELAGREQRRLQALRDSKLTISWRDGWLSGLAGDGARCVAMDDPWNKGSDLGVHFERALWDSAREGVLILMAVDRSLCFEPRRNLLPPRGPEQWLGERLIEPLASNADVVLDLSPSRMHWGTVHINVVRNRRGGTQSVHIRQDLWTGTFKTCPQDDGPE